MDTDYASAKGYLRSEHYYGRIVRKLFLFGGFLMLLSLPFFADKIPVNIAVSISAIVLIGLVAGLLSPIARSAVVLDLVASLVATAVFEYQSVLLHTAGFATQSDFIFFLINQVLAINFFVSTYYGSKTVRGLLFKAKFVDSQ